MNNHHFTEAEWKENAYWDAVIRYLNKETPQYHAVMETKMEDYADLFEDPLEMLGEFIKTVDLLKSGDLITWLKVQEALFSLFHLDPEIELLFIQSATKKGVLIEKVVAHLS